MVPFKINKLKVKKLISDGFIVLTHFDRLEKTSVKAKEQNCQFFLDKNKIKKI